MATNQQLLQTVGTTEPAIRTAPEPLSLGEYMLPDQTSPRVETLLQGTGPPSVASSTSPAVLTSFNDFAQYPNQQRTYPGYANSYTQSPKQVSAPFQHARSGSIANVAESGGFMAATVAAPHRLSMSGANDFKQAPGRSNSIDGMEGNPSPDSLQGYGAGGSLDGFGMEEAITAVNLGDNDQESNNPAQNKKDGQGDAPPPWSEMKTKAWKERKRLPLACIACRRKKIRCSGEKPACKHCLRSRIPCVYKVTTRKAAPRTDYMAMLDKRLKRMEERVIKLIPKDNLGNVAAVGRAVVKPALPGIPAKSATKKRAADEAFGPELDEWAKSKVTSSTGQPPPGPKSQDSEENKLLTEGVDSLPSKEIQQHLAEVYFDHLYGQSYHLLHKPSFMRRLAAGQVPPVLILAVCAIAARFSTHPQLRTEPAFLRGEQWATVAREIAIKRYDTPNITILICYLLLGLHEFGTCQGGRSWMFGGMAQRMAYALQLHKDLTYDPWDHDSKEHPELSSTDREIRRRTLWSCFLMDRFNSSGTDRPMCILERFIQVQLPIKEHYYRMEISGPTEDLEGNVRNPVLADTGVIADAKENMGVAAYLIRAVAIWGRVVKYWNMGGKEADKYSMWSEQSEFCTLRKSVKEYKAKLPQTLHWNAENLQNHTSERTANQFIFLHIVYHQVILFMNRFALPSAAGIRPPKDIPPQFVNEAGRAALDAANQISNLIKEAFDHSVVAPFAGYAAFYSSTVHVQGVFSKNPKVETLAKTNLAHNVKYLSKLKKYWGMFHFVTENLKDLYRQHADAALRGPETRGKSDANKSIFQYGDWFDRYPHGVSQTDYEDPAATVKTEPGTDAVLGQKSDLQSVEEFFASLSPNTQQRKLAAQKKLKSANKHSTHQQQKSGSNNVSAMSPTGDPNQRQHLLRQQHQLAGLQIPATQAFADDPTSAAAFYNSPQSATYTQNLAALQQQPLMPQHQNLVPQLDRHLVLSSYANIDPNTAAQALLSQNFQQQQQPTAQNLQAQSQQQQQQQQQPFTPNTNNPASVWDLDLGVGGPGGGYNTGGAGGLAGWTDPSTAWFMPFNMDPPDIGDDTGIFGGPNYGGFGFDGQQSVVNGDMAGIMVDTGGGTGSMPMGGNASIPGTSGSME